MSITATLDGVSQPITPSVDQQVLVKFENMEPGQHTVILKSGSVGTQSLFTLDKAVVDVGYER